MILNEYTVTIFGATVKTLAVTANCVAKYFPEADSIRLTGSHRFIGNGAATPQSIVKTTNLGNAFEATDGTTTKSSKQASGFLTPFSADLTISQGDTISCTRLDELPVNVLQWRLLSSAGRLYSTQVGDSYSHTFDKSGNYRIALVSVAEGGQVFASADTPEYRCVDVTVTT